MKNPIRSIWAVPVLAGAALLFLIRPALHGDLRLEASRLGTDVLLTWANPAVALEQSLALTSTWSTVEGAVNAHRVEVTKVSSLYRLHKP